LWACGTTQTFGLRNVTGFIPSKLTLLPLPSPYCSYGFCKRADAKQWVRNGRVTFDGEVVTRIDQKVVVR
jgi:hypothetical protein